MADVTQVIRRAGVVVLAVAGGILVAAAFADRLIFFPPPPSYDEGAEGLVRLPTARGDTIAALHLEAPGSALTVLFAHGNAEDVGHLRGYLELYRRLGVSILAFEYPGYGVSTGKPSEAGAYAAADAAYAYLTARVGVAEERIVAHGRSLGGAVMVDLAARSPVGGLVLESSFVSAYRVVTRLPLLPLDQFRSLEKLPRVRVPVLVIHGTRDEVVAPWHGRRLADAVPEERRHTLWVEGAGHNDLVMVAGARYWAALRSFLETVAG